MDGPRVKRRNVVSAMATGGAVGLSGCSCHLPGGECLPQDGDGAATTTTEETTTTDEPVTEYGEGPYGGVGA